MRRYLIHVGPHKTGSTYIQMRLDAARDQLRDAGVTYPAMWRAADNMPSHLGFFERIRNRALGTLRRELAELPTDSLVVVSSEDLQTLDEQEIGILAELLGSSDVTVVYYCRRWSELLPSIWQERVKHGSDEMLPDFLAMMIRHAPQSPLVNFGLVLDRYLRVFGQARVRVVSYSEVTDSQTDLADHFAATFLPSHLGALPPALAARPNASLEACDIETIRMMNAVHLSRGGKASGGLCAWLQRHASALDLSAITAAMSVAFTRMTFSDIAPPLVSLHQESFDQYRALVVPPRSREGLFDHDERVLTYVRPDYLADPAVAVRIETIYRQFRTT